MAKPGLEKQTSQLSPLMQQCTGSVWVWLLAGPIKSNWPNVRTWSVVQYPVTYMGLITFTIDHVKSRLRQWDPWRALDERHGSDIHPCYGETSLKALQSCLGLWPVLLGLIATPGGPNGGVSPHQASHPPLPPTPPAPSTHPFHPPLPPTHPLPPPYTCNPWYHSGCEKSCSKPSSVS